MTRRVLLQLVTGDWFVVERTGGKITATSAGGANALGSFVNWSLVEVGKPVVAINPQGNVIQSAVPLLHRTVEQ